MKEVHKLEYDEKLGTLSYEFVPLLPIKVVTVNFSVTNNGGFIFHKDIINEAYERLEVDLFTRIKFYEIETFGGINT